MAAAVRPLLPGLDRAAYVRFLDAMVHYTRGSGARLEHAAKYAPTPELKAFFADMAADEGGHYRLAEADLQALGASPTDGQASVEPIAEFHRAWLASTNAADWLGALYVLENVANALASDIPPHLVRLGLTKAEARFVLTHLQVDGDHGSKTAEFARQYPPEALLPAAERAARFWIDLHQAAFAG
jgi:heme oxygenase